MHRRCVVDHEVFGVREKDVWMQQRIRLELRDEGLTLTDGHSPGSLRGMLHASTVTLLSPDARVPGPERGGLVEHRR
jgi:hypothetical protein